MAADRMGRRRAARRGSPTAAGLALGLWRAKWIMVGVFAPVAAAGVLFAQTLEPRYEAAARLYVSAPTGVDPVRAMATEASLLRSPSVAEGVIERFGLARLYPGVAAQQAEFASGGDLLEFGVTTLLSDLSVRQDGDSQVMRVVFRHADAELSSDVMNAVLGGYLSRREGLLAGGGVGERANRTDVEADLLALEAEAAALLSEAGAVDLESDRAASEAVRGLVAEELAIVDAASRALEARILEIMTSPKARAPDASGVDAAIARLEAERVDLLTRYQPDSRLIVSLDRRITELNAYRDRAPIEQAEADRPRDARLVALEREAESLAARRDDLHQELASAEARVVRLSALQPRWSAIEQRRREVERRLADLRAEERIRAQTISAQAASVRVLEPARRAPHDDGRRSDVIWLSVAAAAAAAILAGLVQSANRSRLSTVGAAERATGLPVVASPKRR